MAGYKGVVASHIRCDSKCELPISVAVGNKLFFHIVSSANVATRILHWKRQLDISGEFNFIPLDKIYVQDFEYPTSKSNAKKVFYANHLYCRKYTNVFSNRKSFVNFVSVCIDYQKMCVNEIYQVMS